MTNELVPNPCPFCGSKDVGCMEHSGPFFDGHPFSPFARCGCSNCGARGPIEAIKNNAIKAWNKAIDNLKKQLQSNT